MVRQINRPAPVEDLLPRSHIASISLTPVVKSALAGKLVRRLFISGITRLKFLCVFSLLPTTGLFGNPANWSSRAISVSFDKQAIGLGDLVYLLPLLLV